MNNELYDVIIIGAGPAGATAALYTARARLKTLVLESYLVVSQITVTDIIENYPGFVEPVKGQELFEIMKSQARHFGAEFITVESVKKIEKNKNIFQITTESKIFNSIAIIIASGAKSQELGIKGESQFKGRGVSYCAVCDAPFFKDKIVAVVGGGDTAVEEALYLTKFAKKVLLIHRRDRLRATKIIQERAFANNKIEFVWNSVITEIMGETKLQAIKVNNLKNNEEREIQCDGVFVYIGLEPNTDFTKQLIELDENGYILTDSDMRTSVEGIFAAGDCIKKSLRQVVTATGDGAVAGNSARLYIENFKGVAYQ